MVPVGRALAKVGRQAHCFVWYDSQLQKEKGATEMRALEILTYVGAVVGALFLFATFGATGAPQEAAGAALAIAFVAIPYCVCATVQRRKLISRLEESERSGLE